MISSNNAIRQTVHSQEATLNDLYSANVKKVGPTVHTGGQVESSWIQEAIQKIKTVFKTRI